MAQYGLLHIGKTGGNSIRHVACALDINSERFTVFDHDVSLDDAVSEHPSMRLGFVVRDPIDRAVSGFYSRLRQGRPRNHARWRTEEAIAFQYFPTLNELAEALNSDDERLSSAASFSLEAISHLRRGYEHHLRSIELLSRHRNRFYVVCDIQDLDERLPDFFAPLGVDPIDVKRVAERSHVAAYPENHCRAALSDLALTNLRAACAKEYEIYDWVVRELCQRHPSGRHPSHAAIS